METEKHLELHEDWKKRAFLGPLPGGFLRIENQSTQEQQEAADRQAALSLHQMQMLNMQSAHETFMGRLSITISQAKLVRNYGLAKMDPYVRLRVGHVVYETHTASNGAKNPHWNKVIQCLLPPGVTKIYIEIYDERSFTTDELIAWGHVEIPPQVIQRGETHEDWYTLSGKQGENLEGMINLVFSYTNKCHPYMATAPIAMVPSATMFNMVPYAPVNVYTAPPTQFSAPPANQNPNVNPEVELTQISEMFPNVDKEVIKSVYEANNGRKDVTINALLQMCE
ncbi:toll-interacting protein A-like [Prorops nasuta]|uniref:toll-interacting protein A-like n=1 Tax=Prorops nasuta TaxID=863751 RepID=UPI0034CED66B